MKAMFQGDDKNVMDPDAFKAFVEEAGFSVRIKMYEREYDCYEGALEKFCVLHGMDTSEIHNYFVQRYAGEIGLVAYQQPPKPLDGIGMLSRLYKGLKMQDIDFYESTPDYFFVHESCNSGYYPLIKIDGIDQMVPCVRIAFDTPIRVLERGGEYNMKRFNKQIYLCSKCPVSQSALSVIGDGEPWDYKIPFGVVLPPTDIGFGEKFAVGYCGKDHEIYVSSEKLTLKLEFAIKGEMFLLGKDARTKEWCYIDSISDRRKILNVLSRSYCGRLSIGYPITYSITDKVNVFNDLAGVLNRINLNNSKGLVFGDRTGMLKGFRRMFAEANFNFDDLFGVRFGIESDRKNAPNPYVLLNSKDFSHQYSYHSFVQGYTSIADVVRGVHLDDLSIVSDVDLSEFIPGDVVKEIVQIFPDRPIMDSFPDYVKIQFGTSSQFQTDGIRNKLASGCAYDLTDHECVQIFLKMMKLDLYFTKTELVDRATNLHYNLLFIGNKAWVCARGTLIMINPVKCFPFNSATKTRIDRVLSHSGVKVDLGFVMDVNYIKLLRNNYHITWHRPARFRDLFC